MKNSTTDCYLPEPSNNSHGHLGLILVENCFFSEGQISMFTCCSSSIQHLLFTGRVGGLWSMVSHYFMCTCKFLS